MKKLLTLIVFVCSLQTYASQNKVITCPNDYLLSNMFEQRWTHQPAQSRYLSYFTFTLPTGNVMSGIIFTNKNQLPVDKNPHLQLAKVTVEEIEHYGVWNILCHYNIHNSEITTYREDLAMVTTESFYDFDCKKTGHDTITCSQKTKK